VSASVPEIDTGRVRGSKLPPTQNFTAAADIDHQPATVVGANACDTPRKINQLLLRP
jgi:hypothetical protein